ncbi:MAG: alpha/beta hydrolase family esterase [Pseudonocardiaceae bacterium]
MRRDGNQAGLRQVASGRRHLMRTLLAFPLIAVMAALVTFVTRPSFSDNLSTFSGNPPTSPGNPPAAGPPGLVTEMHTVTVDSSRRTYRSIASVQATDRVPLVIVLHGRGQSGSVAASQTGFLGLAQRRQAVLVFPDGEQRSWNAGHGCCGFAGSRRVPDVPFVAAIVADAVHRWPIDVERVYLVGYSNGGKLAYSAVCAHPTLFAAVATYGAVPLSPCPPGTPPVPFLLAAGTADRMLASHGRPAGHPPLPAVPQAVDWLRIQDGCPARAQTRRDGSAVLQRWADCAGGAEVESVVYPGWSHAWPAARAGDGSPAVATLMWAFLSRHDTPSRVPHRPS